MDYIPTVAPLEAPTVLLGGKEYILQQDFLRLAGISRQRLHQLAKEGRAPAKARARGLALIPLAAARAWLMARSAEKARRPGPQPGREEAAFERTGAPSPSEGPGAMVQKAMRDSGPMPQRAPAPSAAQSRANQAAE
jgi:hypothetical protein